MRPIEVVRKVCPKARASYLAAIESGDALFRQHGITTPLRLAHFLAQIMHESGGLTIEWESGAYSATRLVEIFGAPHHSAGVTEAEAERLAYNGALIFERVYGKGNPTLAAKLGNTQAGDGFRYRGGGLMQTTGRYNYRLMGQKCGVDFEARPELVLSAEHALKPALAEWTKQRCNEFADRNDLLSISRAINLGNAQSNKQPNGLADRGVWLAKLKPVISQVDLDPAPAVVVPMPAPKPQPVPAPQQGGPVPPPAPKPAPSPSARNTSIGALIVAAGAAVVGFVQTHPFATGLVVLSCAGAIYALVRFRKKD